MLGNKVSPATLYMASESRLVIARDELLQCFADVSVVRITYIRPSVQYAHTHTHTHSNPSDNVVCSSGAEDSQTSLFGSDAPSSMELFSQHSNSQSLSQPLTLETSCQKSTTTLMGIVEAKTKCDSTQIKFNPQVVIIILLTCYNTVTISQNTHMTYITSIYGSCIYCVLYQIMYVIGCCIWCL